jgi:tetratricopeptide (TPR) repeat protein
MLESISASFYGSPMLRTLLRSPLAPLTLVLLLCAGCPDEARNESIRRTNAGVKALSSKQYETAINELKEATRSLKENHAAHYYLGQANAGKKDWPHASESLAEAVRLKPDNVMYQMMYGVALYEEAVARTREDTARLQNKKPNEVEVDYSQINFDQAEQHLQAAVKLNGDLYFEHAYLGKIARETGRPREAAEEFSKAIVANPREWAPYVALGELYRKWDYPDQAIQVLSQGVEHVPGQADKSDLYFVLGMAHIDKQDDTKAIEAFTQALDTRKDNHRAKFMRGQAFLRKGEYKRADKDLEDFAKSAGSNEAANKSIAQKLRYTIAAKLQGG